MKIQIGGSRYTVNQSQKIPKQIGRTYSQGPARVCVACVVFWLLDAGSVGPKHCIGQTPGWIHVSTTLAQQDGQEPAVPSPEKNEDDPSPVDDRTVNTSSENWHAGELSAPLPEWIRTGNFTDQNAATYHVVHSDFFLTPLDAKLDLQEQMVRYVAELLDQRIHPGAGRVLGIGYAEIRDRLQVPGKYYEAKKMGTPSVIELAGEDYPYMYAHYTSLKTDDAFFQGAERVWQQKVVESRILQIGLFGFAMLGTLGLAFGFLQINRATRGFYAGRLQLIAIGSVIILVAIAAAIAESFDWF